MTENGRDYGKVVIIGGGRNAGRTMQAQVELLARIDELEAYRAIGTVEEFKELKEKSVAKKPNEIERKRDECGFIYQIGKCPCCGKLVTDDRECCDCMQKLDWQ